MYQVGQLRKTQIDNYSEPLNLTLSKQIVNLQRGVDIIDFYDWVGRVRDFTFQPNADYYLRFSVDQLSTEQTFNIKLVNSELTEDNEQTIREFTVPAGDGKYYFELTISPNTVYDEICWILTRTIIDYSTVIDDQDEDNIIGGRVMSIEIIEFSQLTDIIKTYFRTKYQGNLTKLVKMGIQGPPSLLMCINREEIRIGKSGIYEINNGVNINSISFVPKDNDYFIMDFEY